MGLLIATSLLSCNIQQFRARIERLDNFLGAKSWISPSGKRLVFGEYPYVRLAYESVRDGDHVPMGMLKWTNELDQDDGHISVTRRSPTRGSWIVMPWSASSMRPWYHPQKGVYTASIEAYEEAENRVRVDFLDGYSPEDPKKDFPQIGEPFNEFVQMLLREFASQGTKSVDDNSLGVGEERNLLSIKLFEILSHRFDEEDLKTFCFYLGVAFENLPAIGKNDKARELILYFARREELEIIAEIGVQLRSDINWPSL